MKKVVIVLALLGGSYISKAQDEESKGDERKGGFKKENLFVGGDVTLAFSNGYTVLGASPYFGYSINKYIDVAASFNYIYSSERDVLDYGDKVRQTQYGPGAFVRIYPLNFLFVQAQYEHNFIKVKYLPVPNSIYAPSTRRVDANSLLVGAGFAGGREEGNSSFYFFSASLDLLRNENSPYVNEFGRSILVIRAGYNFALFQGTRYRR